MKRIWIALVNIFIIVAVLVFVIEYSAYGRRNIYRQQVESFESTTVTMEKVTENYLQGEQGICDVWAHYINVNDMTISEATEFIRVSHVLKNTSAHLIYTDTLTGFSTRDDKQASESCAVSYEELDLFNDIEWIADVGEAVNITRSFANPVNGENSLAFCNRIQLIDETTGERRDALLLRIVPIYELEEKWVFPQPKFKDAEFTMIDGEGNYIIKGDSLEGENFFEFYDECCGGDHTMTDGVKKAVAGSSGTFHMDDRQGKDRVVAHTAINLTNGWVLLRYIYSRSLEQESQNWLLIFVVSGGLFTLFIIDLLYMMYLNRRLQLLAKEAETASKAKTDFLSTMSHDIRTPMNAIIGLTAIAKKNIDDKELVGENLKKIGLASNHLLTLINDILDISKVESGKLSLSKMTFSIVDTVENLVSISQPMIKEKNLDFSFRINRMEKEYLYADQLRLNQIYINILSNAIKYTEPGKQVSVDMREEKSTVPGCVKLTYIVADKGIGMSPEYMKRMYEPFSRQTDSRVNTIQGTGLGLSITKKLVDMMNGTIECQSELGKGTVFTVVLDIPYSDRQLDEMRLDNIDMLVVDDDAILLDTAVDTLSSLGISADTAQDGMTAIGMIKHRRQTGKLYDMVILDWKMPGMDGIETARQIRSEIDAKMPILLISAYDWSEIEDRAKSAGADGFISKPLFRSKLYEKINDLLGRESKAVDIEDDYSDITGMHILVAEDNDINWEIISALLGMYSITCERAENGRICVDMMNKAEKGRYSLIFMDIQMSEMNGLDATREIRKSPDPWVSSIPIIAMTADAFSENIAECLEAGMNGHIAKPVDIKLVIKEIRRIKEEKAKKNRSIGSAIE